MNNILFNYLDDFYIAYLDDILIYLENKLNYQEHVYKVLLQLYKAGLQANIKKSKFSITYTKYLGFYVSIDRIVVDLEKTKTIYNQERPTIVYSMQSFLSFYNFYQKFILNYRQIACLLTALTYKENPFTQTINYQQAFIELKARLINALLLVHFNLDYELIVETDALDRVLGSILLQLQPSREQQPIPYYSKTMILVEINYLIYNKEMLAIIQALEAQRLELEGLATYIQIVSNYKALEYFMTTKALSSRQAHQAKTLLQFNFMLTYKPSSQNWAHLLTYRDQEMDSQIAMKISTYTQTLLQPKNLDLQIVIDLDLDPLYIGVEVAAVNRSNRTYDLINDLLQANCISLDLETLQ